MRDPRPRPIQLLILIERFIGVLGVLRDRPRILQNFLVQILDSERKSNSDFQPLSLGGHDVPAGCPSQNDLQQMVSFS